MKKLMFMLAAIACVVAAQAATFKWSTGTLRLPDDEGTLISSDNGTWSAVLTLYTDSAMTSPVSGAGGLTADTPNASGALGNTVTGLSTGDTYYGIVSVTGTYKGETYNINITDPVEIKFKASGTTQLNFSTAIANAGGWPSGGDIPEPTSGILLLVGAGMLALRRKQK